MTREYFCQIEQAEYLGANAVDQSFIIPVGEISSPDAALEDNIARKKGVGRGAIKDDMSGCMARGVAYFEFDLAQFENLTVRKEN